VRLSAMVHQESRCECVHDAAKQLTHQQHVRHFIGNAHLQACTAALHASLSHHAFELQ
jgi:hypothetical protein